MADSILTEFPGQAGGAEERLEAQVYRKLFDMIRFGTYEMGQRLPSEAELGEEHGVSRPVIRAALSKLRDSGLIVSRQGSGSFVSSGVPSTAGGYTPLSSITDIASYFNFRRLIEGTSAELAAEKATAKQAKTLRDMADEMGSLAARNEQTVGLDIKFHVFVAELSDNRFVVETLDMLHPHWIFVGNFVQSLGITGQRRGKRMTNEHLAIVEAIEAGDPVRARKAMLVHVDGSEHRVFKGQP